MVCLKRQKTRFIAFVPAVNMQELRVGRHSRDRGHAFLVVSVQPRVPDGRDKATDNSGPEKYLQGSYRQEQHRFQGGARPEHPNARQ